MFETSRMVIDAAASAWSAASFCIAQGDKTVLFEHQDCSPDGAGQSILACRPRQWLVESKGQYVEGPSGREIDDPRRWIKDRHQPVGAAEGLPFVGGIAGYAGFEFGWQTDTPCVDVRRSSSPRLWVGWFPTAAVYDHGDHRWTVVGGDEQSRRWLAERILSAPAEAVVPGEDGQRPAPNAGVDADSYRQAVQAAVDAIYAGEFFEVNYTERFRGIWGADRRGLYAGLRARAPGNYGGVVSIPEVFIASVSPEQFLCADADRRVRTRPIKGTRPRGNTDDEDRRLAQQLVKSEKDRAENVMIVDLMRNDLTRVCQPGSVRATELCKLVSFPSVHHLVSTVEGRLAEPFCALDAFWAAFPAGSITGAPKLRAMEWIAVHETSARGPYTGSMFYWSDDGQFDSNVLIRTAVLHGDEVEYGAGGAVVADSEPDGEYEEALWKAKPFLDLLSLGETS